MAIKLKVKSGLSRKLRYSRKQKVKPKLIKKAFKGVHGKLAIPQVNQNPLPPNATPQQQQAAQQQNATSSSLQNLASTQTPGQTPQSSQNLSAFSSYIPEAGKTDPRDEDYWRDVTRLYFDRTQQENELNTQDVYGKTAYEQALEERTREHPRDILASNISANQMGNLLSSVQQENLGQLEQNYYTANTDAEREYQREQAVRATARQALAQGYTLDEAAALAAAVDRQSQRELDRQIPPDPNADTYSDTYGLPPDLQDALDRLLGGGGAGGAAKKRTASKKTTKKTTRKTTPKKIRIKSAGLAPAVKVQPKKKKK